MEGKTSRKVTENPSLIPSGRKKERGGNKPVSKLEWKKKEARR
jgi:hypothetical protein